MSAAIRVRALGRTAIVGVIATAGLLLSAIPALAHITVTPGSVQAGSTAVLTFHVPNEESTADTVKVDVQIPTDHPIAQFLVKPVPGWSVSVKTVKLAKPLVTDDGQFTQAVSEVIWSGGQIAPGQFEDFSVSADPLPEGVSQLVFKAIQTYSNGDVVRWIDLSQPGKPEPDHPAPVLTLTAGAAAAPPASGTSVSATSAAAPAAVTTGSDDTARDIAIGGVVIGLLGLALAGLAWRRGRAAVAPSAPDLDGSDLAMATAPVPEPRNGTQPKRADVPARQAPSRKGAGNRRQTRR
ncbi:MAG TPA: YcnI family protein [Streptosporangiaceae bacterium]|nr:YcnI family protein [Streptosporangiaceae bacterium]